MGGQSYRAFALDLPRFIIQKGPGKGLAQISGLGKISGKSEINCELDPDIWHRKHEMAMKVLWAGLKNK